VTSWSPSLSARESHKNAILLLNFLVTLSPHQQR